MNTITPHLAIFAGAARWQEVRQIAAYSGCSLEESKGWFHRSFVVRGTVLQLLTAKALFQGIGFEVQP